MHWAERFPVSPERIEPMLPTSILVEAAKALQAPGDRVVLGPALDGSYHLIGLKQPHRRLFEDITWSTERVFRQTVERAASTLDVVTLPIGYDGDDAKSLGWLCRKVLTRHRPPDCVCQGYAESDTSAYLRALAASGGGECLGVDRTVI
jgi:hypothetical protein